MVLYFDLGALVRRDRIDKITQATMRLVPVPNMDVPCKTFKDLQDLDERRLGRIGSRLCVEFGLSCYKLASEYKNSTCG